MHGTVLFKSAGQKYSQDKSETICNGVRRQDMQVDGFGINTGVQDCQDKLLSLLIASQEDGITDCNTVPRRW
jgi:hypothetical protein